MFRADVGVDSEVGNYGSVLFQVYGDGVKPYDSGVVTGVNELKLVTTDGGDGINNDHADWVNARVIN